MIKGILSFPQVFEPRAAVQGSEPRYSVQVLLRPDDPQVAQVQQEIEQAKANMWPSGAPAGVRSCFQSYDEKYSSKTYYDPNLSGWWVLTCNAKQNDPPVVVNEQRQPVLDRGDVFSGCVAYVAYGVSGYDRGAVGVGAFLNGIMLTAEQPPLGRLDGKPSADQMFAQVDGVAPVAPAAPPAAPAAPAGPVMTPAAEHSYEAYQAAGWSDEQLVQQGLLAP